MPLSRRVAGKMLLNRGTTISNERPPSVAASAAFAKRDIISWGGYSLLVGDAACPSDTSKCGEESCCPNGTFCFEDSNGFPICCPDENVDCSETVKRVYACADTLWTLWEHWDMFCCQADEVGTEDLGEKCLPTNIPVPTSIIVSSVKQQTKAVALPTDAGSPNSEPTSPSGGSGSSSSSDSGLSTPATIAIAILATGLGIALVFLVWFFCYRSYKKKRMTAAAAGAGGTAALPPPTGGPTGLQAAQVLYPATGPVSFVSGAGAGTGTGAPAFAPTTAPHPPQSLYLLGQSTPSPGPPAYVKPHPQTLPDAGARVAWHS